MRAGPIAIGDALADSLWAFIRELPGATRSDTAFGVIMRSDPPVADANILFVRNHMEADRLPQVTRKIAATFPEGTAWKLIGPENGKAGLPEPARALGLRPARAFHLMTREGSPDADWGAFHRRGIVLTGQMIEEFNAFRESLADSFGSKEWVIRALMPRVPSASKLIIEQRGLNVATAAVTVSHDVSVLSHIGVPRRFRRRGLGTLATVSAIGLGISLGGPTVALLATPVGQKLYSSLGFRPIQQYGVYEKPLGFFDRSRAAHTLRQMGGLK